jgi:hypothetical protein
VVRTVDLFMGRLMWEQFYGTNLRDIKGYQFWQDVERTSIKNVRSKVIKIHFVLPSAGKDILTFVRSRYRCMADS